VFKFWCLIGYLVWLFYIHINNDGKLCKKYIAGELSITSYIVGLLLTIMFWPIAIYNNSIKEK